MIKWIFLKDFDVINDFDQAINLDFVTHFNLRIKEKQLVLFFGAHSEDPHILNFKDAAACQKAYDELKVILKSQPCPTCNCGQL
jgi:hypothetical protein